MAFTNSAKPKTVNRPSEYGYDAPSKYLFLWSGLLQQVISQAGTFLLTGKFHDRSCSIFKCEGGCVIDGVGDLVPCKRSCYFDGFYGPLKKKEEKQIEQLAKLITAIVLEWDPENPVETMLDSACKFVKCDKTELTKALKQSHEGGNPFRGNSLSAFFDWNPFSKPPIDRDYEGFCLIKFSGWTEEKVLQKWADQDLGEKLLEKINAKFKQIAPNNYYSALCCSPRRDDSGLAFWVNTGRRTQIDGWQTEESIEEFFNNATEVIDKAKY